MQPDRFQYDLENCGIRRALDVVGEKWTLLILREAVYGVRRFDDFARALRCGRGVLSDRLKSLTSAGVLEQRDYALSGQRPRSEYHLTDKGRDLFPTLVALSQWSERWTPARDGPVAKITDRRTGNAARVVLTSDAEIACLTMMDVVISPGPGARLIEQ